MLAACELAHRHYIGQSPIPPVTSGAERDQIWSSDFGVGPGPDTDTFTGRPTRLMCRCGGPGAHTWSHA